jgi:group II intron reverse transcriptase/maturase
VKRNKGAAGVDAETIASIRALGEESFLNDLSKTLRAGRYRPQAVRRHWIPKSNGGRRPLGIPTVRDRVVQTAAKLVLEPIFEVDFLECSHGFRPGRSATGALEKLRLRSSGNKGNHVFDADIRDFFGSLDREILMKRVQLRVSDRRVLSLIRQWLEAGVMDDGREIRMLSGTPQGGVISPLLSNIYLGFLDERWTKQCAHVGTLVRYCDDFVIVCDSKKNVDETERRVKLIFARLRCSVPLKSRHSRARDSDCSSVRVSVAPARLHAAGERRPSHPAPVPRGAVLARGRRLALRSARGWRVRAMGARWCMGQAATAAGAAGAASLMARHSAGVIHLSDWCGRAVW